MRHLTALAAAFLAVAHTFAAHGQPVASPDSTLPRLVVTVVVDQLRADLLDRYDDHFVAGFRRLRDDGYRFTKATVFHANTETGAGHASIVTGLVPRRHGIVGNNWLERAGRRWRVKYAVGDTSAHIVGFDEMPGRSPAPLLRDGLPDWIRHARPGAKVVSVSRKDRAAVTMGGKTRGHVYWFAPPERRFVTSTYYRDTYPDWLDAFNADSLGVILSDSVWNTSVPDELRHLARRDSADFEGPYSAFPHRYDQEGIGYVGGHGAWISDTPFMDVATLRLAEYAMRTLDLGTDDEVDYLAVNLSATDRVGHRFGPLSQEQFDNLLRLDRSLGLFLEALDEHAGAGRWLLVLTSDHGVQTIPEHQQELGYPGRRLTEEDVRELKTVISAALVAGGAEDVPSILTRELPKLDFVDGVYRVRDHWSPSPADSFAILFRNSIHPDRPLFSTFETTIRTPLFGAYGVNVRFAPNVLASGDADGTDHGSPHWYDRHVPIIFLGSFVQRGSSAEFVHTVDVAPTLAHLLNIPYPPDLDGRPILSRH